MNSLLDMNGFTMVIATQPWKFLGPSKYIELGLWVKMLPAEDGMIIWYNLHNIMGGIEVESHTRKKKVTGCHKKGGQVMSWWPKCQLQMHLRLMTLVPVVIGVFQPSSVGFTIFFGLDWSARYGAHGQAKHPEHFGRGASEFLKSWRVPKSSTAISGNSIGGTFFRLI